jgi:hypothetical protein
MRTPCKITIKLLKLFQVAKFNLKQEWCLTISANNPNRVQISYIFSPKTSCYVKMRVLYVYLYKILTFNYFSGKKQGRAGQSTTKFNFDINKINLHLETPPRVTSCRSRVALSPISETLGWKSGAFHLQKPQMMLTLATRLTNDSKK